MASILNFLSVALQFLGVLTLVVFIHELGHFLVARWCGVKVAAFSIGFGPEIAAFNDRHGTRWRLAWIPLGGYVRFIDDETAASTSHAEALTKLTPEDRAGAFQTQPVGKRALVVAAGPAFNILSAIIIYIVTFWLLGSYGTAPIIDGVVPKGVADEAGLKAGDRITQINGEKIEWFSDLQRIVGDSVGVPLAVEFERNGRVASVMLTPRLTELRDPLCNLVKVGVIGIRRDASPLVSSVKAGGNLDRAGFLVGDRIVAIAGKPIGFASEVRQALVGRDAGQLPVVVARSGHEIPLSVAVTPVQVDIDCKKAQAVVLDGVLGGNDHWQHKSYNFTGAVGQGLSQTWYASSRIVLSLPTLPGEIAKTFSGQRSNALGGPIAIAEMTAYASQNGLSAFLGWIAVFSIMLGIMNLLPIPVLDGGHLVFYALEAVRGRPLDERKQELGFRIGLAILATMMFAALFGDIMRKLGIG